MSSGGMGPLEPDKKYVVVIEVYGKKTKAEGDEFDAIMAQLRKKFGARIKLKLHASKNPGDPK